MVCNGLTDRFEVTNELINSLGLTTKVKLIPVDSSYWQAEYSAPRPPNERLINKKLDMRGLNVMRDWRLCLNEYMEKYYQGYLT